MRHVYKGRTGFVPIVYSDVAMCQLGYSNMVKFWSTNALFYLTYNISFTDWVVCKQFDYSNFLNYTTTIEAEMEGA